jgi:hypothetical protein
MMSKARKAKGSIEKVEKLMIDQLDMEEYSGSAC